MELALRELELALRELELTLRELELALRELELTLRELELAPREWESILYKRFCVVYTAPRATKQQHEKIETREGHTYIHILRFTEYSINRLHVRNRFRL